MPNYQIVVVEDNELPAGIGWVIALTLGGAYLLVTQGQFDAPGGMGLAWIAWMTLVAEPEPPAEKWWSLLPRAAAS